MDIINTEAVAREARKGINELHQKTIGLFRLHAMDRPELVINNANVLFKRINSMQVLNNLQWMNL